MNKESYVLEMIELSQEKTKKQLSKKCNVGDLCPNCKAEVLSILTKHFSNKLCFFKFSLIE
jgi:bacterioferritin-associated ferredoxin